MSYYDFQLFKEVLKRQELISVNFGAFILDQRFYKGITSLSLEVIYLIH